jgi:hypothetical protein
MNIYIFIDMFASIYIYTRRTVLRCMSTSYAASVDSKEAVLEVPWR